jgi:antitoxin (DNA-binding transcriptional repressor) of toxin-antitoxin stability system
MSPVARFQQLPLAINHGLRGRRVTADMFQTILGGETLIITRHGRAIARIVPEVDRRQEEVDRALASILEL